MPIPITPNPKAKSKSLPLAVEADLLRVPYYDFLTQLLHKPTAGFSAPEVTNPKQKNPWQLKLRTLMLEAPMWARPTLGALIIRQVLGVYFFFNTVLGI